MFEILIKSIINIGLNSKNPEITLIKKLEGNKICKKREIYTIGELIIIMPSYFKCEPDTKLTVKIKERMPKDVTTQKSIR